MDTAGKTTTNTKNNASIAGKQKICNILVLAK